jgi:hypothetical protein
LILGEKHVEYIYRLRSIDALLKNHELEKQEIYLSPFHKLNDPMEGYSDVFWRGDTILWENLLNNYILHLCWTTIHFFLLENSTTFKPPDLQVTLSEQHLPTDQFRKIVQNTCNRFFLYHSTTETLNAFKSDTALRMRGLGFLLMSFHRAALYSLFEELAAYKLIKPELLQTLKTPNSSIANLLSLAANINIEDEKNNIFETLGSAAIAINKELSLQFLNQKNIKSHAEKTLFLIIEFPWYYAESIASITSHDVRVACFTSNCENSSMWSTYADNHRGAALMFEPQKDTGDLSLTLSTATSVSTSQARPDSIIGYSKGKHRLHKVTYNSRAPTIDFFQSIGKLPWPQLLQQWYTRQDGSISPVVRQINSNEENWRKHYWDSITDIAKTKLEDWKHEQEFRLIIPDILGLKAKHPTAKFEFSELAGLVFGLKTSTKDKLEIIRIIDEKCRQNNREKFIFKQITYDPSQGRLVAT